MPLLAYSCYGGDGLLLMQEGIERIKLVYFGFIKNICVTLDITLKHEVCF